MFGRAKVTTPNEPSQTVTSRDEPSQAVTVGRDMDIDSDSDTELDADSDNDNDIDMDADVDSEKIITSTKLMPSASELLKRHYDFEMIDIMAQGIDEESDGDYPYVTRLVEKFYEINEQNGWIGTNGEPIRNPAEWYKQYLDTPLENGYLIKSIAISEA